MSAAFLLLCRWRNKQNKGSVPVPLSIFPENLCIKIDVDGCFEYNHPPVLQGCARQESLHSLPSFVETFPPARWRRLCYWDVPFNLFWLTVAGKHNYPQKEGHACHPPCFPHLIICTQPLHNGSFSILLHKICSRFQPFPRPGVVIIIVFVGQLAPPVVHRQRNVQPGLMWLGCWQTPRI